MMQEEMSGTKYPDIQHHIPEKHTPQSCNCSITHSAIFTDSYH